MGIYAITYLEMLKEDKLKPLSNVNFTKAAKVCQKLSLPAAATTSYELLRFILKALVKTDEIHIKIGGLPGCQLSGFLS